MIIFPKTILKISIKNFFNTIFNQQRKKSSILFSCNKKIRRIIKPTIDNP